MFEWNEECQETFEGLKNALTTTPILTLPSDEAEYILDCDACDYGIGAVLSQSIDGEERVVSYGSRLLSRAEKNYCVTRKELLAVVYFARLYRQYLLGRPFVLRTDHAALQWLQRTPEPIGQQSRWLEILAEFEFRIVHRPGRKHGNADALSRKPCRQCGVEDLHTVAAVVETTTRSLLEAERPDGLEKAQREDLDLAIVRPWLEDGTSAPDLQALLWESATVKIYWHQRERLYLRDGIMYKKTPDDVEQVLVPKALREEFLRLAHTGLTGGHLGVRRTRWQVRRRGYWVGWSADVKRFCQRCRPCNRYFRGRPPRRGPLQPLPCGEPWERLSIDVVGPFPRSRQGHIFMLTIMDNFTKFVEAVPMSNQEASSVAKALVETVIVRYGAPLQILTDQGSNFESQLFRELCKLLGIDKVRTSCYHPSGNGLIERFHRTLNTMLGKVVSSHQHDWENFLPYVLAAYRASRHEATGFSPNRLLFGRETRGAIDLIYGRPPDVVGVQSTYCDYVQDLAERMDSAYRTVREELRTAAERRKHAYDMRVRTAEYLPGTYVWYYCPRRFTGRSAKWEKTCSGPFLVLEKCGPVTYRIRKTLNSRPFVAHVDKLRPCLDEGLAEEEEDLVDIPVEAVTTIGRPRRTIRRPARFQ